jgi:hypothetical protein
MTEECPPNDTRSSTHPAPGKSGNAEVILLMERSTSLSNSRMIIDPVVIIRPVKMSRDAVLNRAIAMRGYGRNQVAR